MTLMNHVANICQIFTNSCQDLKSLQVEIEATENNLLYWAESGIETGYILTDESDEPETVENRQVESISRSQPQAKLLPLEEVRDALTDHARLSLNDLIKVEICSSKCTKLSQLTVEQTNTVFVVAETKAGGT